MSISFQRTYWNQTGIHILETNKFKTNTIVIQIQQPLQEELVTKNALIPFILNRGSKKYPSTKKLREQLDDLYGATLSVDVSKKGERQLITFKMEITNETYLKNTTPLLAQGIQLLGEVLTNPLVENDHFNEKYVSSEKSSMKKRLESLIDDKIKYANQRCTEEMSKNEPYRLMAYGELEKIHSYSGEDLYAAYLKLLQNSPIDIYIVGDVNSSEVVKLIQESFYLPTRDVMDLPDTLVKTNVTEIKEVIERLDVNQGKLNMGCRTNTSYKDDDYVPLMVYNAILGGFPHSKLFTNVREKASLAYYAVSRLESHKGIMMIMSGIEIDNYDKAVGIIKEQLQMMENGNITENELNQSKAVLVNQLKENLDNPYTLIDMDYNGIIAERKRPFEEIIGEIRKTDVEDIVNIAKKVKLDTIYFLRDKKGV
ncbi:insulinase family protein [Microaerobacter geothermalis]|uniref:EF-P 5-aminopentanol modification-associated protein YfmF n=1 Tax=Microaerobacter geothermalis TaxID=674972 RepID=UPI001F2BB5FA|nr:pitrilysin family protein [Microaerobacter geothermalis]MCF6093162.1 insulinase family protein [Microaerobacter geothermalis]